VAEEAGDDDFGDVRGVGTAAGHTHHSEHQQRRERPIQHHNGRENPQQREREREKKSDRSGGYVCFPLAYGKENSLVYNKSLRWKVWTYNHALSLSHYNKDFQLGMSLELDFLDRS